MKCELCGAPVKIEGHTTHYYVNEYDKLTACIKIAKDALEKIMQPEKDIGLGCYHETYADEALKQIEELMK